MKRPIRGIIVGDLKANDIISPLPTFSTVDPASLLVDEEYQRALSEKSIKLIRRIVAGWDWAKFKPPVCAQTDDGLEVIDGQHTAIAAATHPLISEIPIIIVVAESMADRAKAFVGHNKDRLGITPMQMHYSALAAGDEDAQTIAQVCERAGVNILKTPPANGGFKVGDTVALAAIGSLVSKRGAKGARIVLECLAKAGCAQVSSDGIKAVEALLYDDEYAGSVDIEDITSTVMRMGSDAISQARLFKDTHKVPTWRGLAVTLYRNTRKKRKAA